MKIFYCLIFWGRCWCQYLTLCWYSKTLCCANIRLLNENGDGWFLSVFIFILSSHHNDLSLSISISIPSHYLVERWDNNPFLALLNLLLFITCDCSWTARKIYCHLNIKKMQQLIICIFLFLPLHLNTSSCCFIYLYQMVTTDPTSTHQNVTLCHLVYWLVLILLIST